MYAKPTYCAVELLSVMVALPGYFVCDTRCPNDFVLLEVVEVNVCSGSGLS